MKGQNTNRLNLRDAKAIAAIFSATVAITIASIYHLARIGFNNPTWPVLTTLSLSFFLLFLPQGCNFLLQRLQLDFKQSWLTTDAAISLLGLITLTLSGFIAPIFSVNLLPLFSFIGFILFVTSYTVFFRSANFRQNLIFLSGTILFSVWVTSAVVGGWWQNYLLKEELIVGNGSSSDPLFHSAISNMIKTYGVPSTGLDGLPYLPYHFGSHWIFAQLSNLLSIDSNKFYQLGFPIIFIPFLFSRLVSFSLDIRQYIHFTTTNYNLRTDCTYWLLFCVAYINCIPSALLKQQIIPPWNAYPVSLTSESYTVGLALSFILFSLTLFFFQHIATEFSQLNTIEIIFFIVVFPLIIVLICLSKVSCAFVVLATFIYLFVRLKLYKYRVFKLTVIVTILILFCFYLSRLPNNSESSTFLKLWGFVTDNVQDGWKVFFFFINFFWSWLFILLKLYERNIKTLGDFRSAYISNSILDVEIIFILCMVGIAPGVFFTFPAGASFYFSDIQTWISLSFILANLQTFTLLIRRIIR